VSFYPACVLFFDQKISVQAGFVNRLKGSGCWLFVISQSFCIL